MTEEFPMYPPADDHLFQRVLKWDGAWPSAGFSETEFDGQSDEKLLEIIKRGSRWEREGAFSEVYNRYYLDVWRFLRSKSIEEDDAKDLFSKVWLEAVKKLPSFEWRGKPINVWLVSVAHRKCLEYFRGLEEEKDVPLEARINDKALQYIDKRLDLDSNKSPEEPSPIVKTRADSMLAKAIAGLSPRDRKIVTLRYFKEMTSTEIGQILDMKPGTVRVALRRALKTLRRILRGEKRNGQRRS